MTIVQQLNGLIAGGFSTALQVRGCKAATADIEIHRWSNEAGNVHAVQASITAFESLFADRQKFYGVKFLDRFSLGPYAPPGSGAFVQQEKPRWRESMKRFRNAKTVDLNGVIGASIVPPYCTIPYNTNAMR